MTLPEKEKDKPLQAPKPSTSTIIEPDTAQPPQDDGEASTVPAPELEGWSQDRQPSVLSVGDLGLPPGSHEKDEPPAEHEPGFHAKDEPPAEHEEPSPQLEKSEAATEKPEALPETQTKATDPIPPAAAAPFVSTDAIPLLGDKKAPEPPKNEPSLSPSAIDKRMRRVMTPRSDGSLKVPQKFVDEWKKKGTARKSLEKILASVGYDTDGLQKSMLQHTHTCTSTYINICMSPHMKYICIYICIYVAVMHIFIYDTYSCKYIFYYVYIYICMYVCLYSYLYRKHTVCMYVCCIQYTAQVYTVYTCPMLL